MKFEFITHFSVAVVVVDIMLIIIIVVNVVAIAITCSKVVKSLKFHTKYGEPVSNKSYVKLELK